MFVTMFVAATSLAWPAAATAQQAKTRPNIVLIMADDLGYGDVGWHGGPYKTPHLDTLAKSAVRLETHYSLPVCSPTRSSLLTGRFNSRFGCISPTNARVLPFETVTLARALQSLGYRTALIGKWHLGSRPDQGPQLFGFDHSYGSLAGGVSAYGHVYKEGEFAPTWHRNGKLIAEEGHVTDLLTKEAVGFIEAKRDGPFFLYVPYTAVHLPIDEPKQWLDLYAGEKDDGARYYGACVSHMDDGVGKIVQALQRTGQLDNTLIIFLSDNGGSTGTQNNDTRYAGTHPAFRIPAFNGIFRGKKATLYEGGIRTPALVYWSGKLRGRDEHTPIHVADWFPTLAGLTGYRAKQDLKWDGQDVWPVIQGEQKLGPRTLYFAGPGGAHALRHGDTMLIRQKGKQDELYDLAKDVRQQHDLAATQPQRLQEMLALMQHVAENDNDARVKEK
jgi:arylsulfatase A-like enzyme